jgi:hypothetical protein
VIPCPGFGKFTSQLFIFEAIGNATKTTKQELSTQKGASMLGSLGARKTRVSSGQKYDQVRWALPYPEFDAKEIRPQDGATSDGL